MTKISTWPFLAYQEIGNLLKYGEKKRIENIAVPKITALCEEHFEESCFDKSVDLWRRLMNSKDELKFNFVFVL